MVGAASTSRTVAPPGEGRPQHHLASLYGAGFASTMKSIDTSSQSLTAAQTTGRELVETERRQGVESELATLQQQDEEMLRKYEVRAISIVAHFCLHCCKFSEGFPKACQLEGHQKERRQCQKERLQCQNCKWSIFVLNGKLPKNCDRCRAEHPWRKVFFYQERSATKSSGALSVSGVFGDDVGNKKESFHARGVDHQRALDFIEGI